MKVFFDSHGSDWSDLEVGARNATVDWDVYDRNVCYYELFVVVVIAVEKCFKFS